MRRSNCRSVLALMVLCSTGIAAAQGLAKLETHDLRLLYFDPTETYLAPHVARCYQNSLAGHKSILGFEPREKTTLFLKDFTDYGNAALRDAFANAAFRDAMSNAALRDAFNNAAFRDAFNNAAFRSAFNNAAIRNAFNNAAFRDATAR